MPAIVGIVRPFQSQTVSPTNVASSEVQKTGLVVLTIGGSSSSGGAKSIPFSYSLSVTTYMTKQEKEKSVSTDIFASSGAGSNQIDAGGQSGAPDFGTVPGFVEEGP